MFSKDEIRLLRLSRFMKQDEIAKKLGITKQRYSQLENHKNLSEERIKQIITAPGYTVETAKIYIKSIPPIYNKI